MGRASFSPPRSFLRCSLCPVTLPPLLQEGVELSLDVVEWVFTHVVHLARFPALFPLLGGDLRRRRSGGGCGLLHRVLVKLILRDRGSEWENEYGTGRALYKVWVSPSQPYWTLSKVRIIIHTGSRKGLRTVLKGERSIGGVCSARVAESQGEVRQNLFLIPMFRNSLKLANVHIFRGWEETRRRTGRTDCCATEPLISLCPPAISAKPAAKPTWPTGWNAMATVSVETWRHATQFQAI